MSHDCSVQTAIDTYNRSMLLTNKKFSDHPYHKAVHASINKKQLCMDIGNTSDKLAEITEQQSIRKACLKKFAELCGIAWLDPVIVGDVCLILKDSSLTDYRFSSSLMYEKCLAYANLHNDQIPPHGDNPRLRCFNATVAAFTMKLEEINGSCEDKNNQSDAKKHEPLKNEGTYVTHYTIYTRWNRHNFYHNDNEIDDGEWYKLVDESIKMKRYHHSNGSCTNFYGDIYEIAEVGFSLGRGPYEKQVFDEIKNAKYDGYDVERQAIVDQIGLDMYYETFVILDQLIDLNLVLKPLGIRTVQSQPSWYINDKDPRFGCYMQSPYVEFNGARNSTVIAYFKKLLLHPLLRGMYVFANYAQKNRRGVDEADPYNQVSVTVMKPYLNGERKVDGVTFDDTDFWKNILMAVTETTTEKETEFGQFDMTKNDPDLDKGKKWYAVMYDSNDEIVEITDKESLRKDGYPYTALDVRYINDEKLFMSAPGADLSKMYFHPTNV